MQQPRGHSALSRRLGLPVMVLYGIGTTIGAGIYALLGEIAGVAGDLAPWSFVVASALAGFTALSFGELSSRMPRAGATALYVQTGFGSVRFAQIVGALVIASGVVSASALVNGMVGYVQEFAEVERVVVVVLTVLVLVALAAWGIEQSAWVAGVISVIEVGGLVWVMTQSAAVVDPAAIDWARFVPESATWPAIVGGSVLAFYAYIGFEDMVEVAEEVKSAERTLPIAILLTLVVSSLVYVLLVTIALLAVPPAFLAASAAPLADLLSEVTGGPSSAISAIGLLAIVNGALIQVIMASRVIYGLASRGQLPSVFARVHPGRLTPIAATLAAGVVVLGLALWGSLGTLAAATSTIMLTVFALANLALWRLKSRNPEPARFMIPTWVPLVGGIVCAAFAVRAAVSLLS